MVSFPQVSLPKPCTHLSSPTCATCPAHLTLLYFITRTILGEQYRSLSSLLYSFPHSPVTSSLLGPNILNTLFSNTLSLTFLLIYPISLYAFFLSFHAPLLFFLPRSNFHPFGIDRSPRIHLYLASFLYPHLCNAQHLMKIKQTNRKSTIWKRKSSQCDKYLPNTRAAPRFLH